MTGSYELALTSSAGGPELTVAITAGGIAENGGSSQGTVTRNSGTASALLVNLTSSDTSEAVVSSVITIPGGATSAPFTVSAVDDLFLDGTQIVTITASAAGHDSGIDTLTVSDNEGDDHSNAAPGATHVAVPSRTIGNIDVSMDRDWFAFDAVGGRQYTLKTALLSLADSALTLFAPDGVTQLAFNDDSGGLASRIDWTAPADGKYFVEVRAIGLLTGSYFLDTEGPALTLGIADSSISENPGTSQATVKRNSATTGALTVNLASSDPSQATVPANVTIPTGSSSATFTITAVNDTVLDGTQTVAITTTAAGHATSKDTLDVIDNEPDDHGNSAAAATVVAPPSTIPGAIEVRGDVDFFQFIATAGSTYTIETVLGTLQDSTLRLYATNGTVLAQDDDSGPGLGSRIVFTAPVSGATHFIDVAAFDRSQTGTYTLTMAVTTGPPPPQPTLSVDIFAASISENGGTTQGTVTRANSTGALTVNLATSDTTEATVPASVTIPSGSNSATFAVNAVNDTDADGAQTVTITATAIGHTSGSDTVVVLDDDGGGGGPFDDHGNNAATATPVAVPSATAGDIESNGDVDWFRFVAQAGTRYIFQTGLSTLPDSVLTLYGTDGVTRLESNDDFNGLGSRIEWTAPANGTFYLEVAAFSTRMRGTYGLTVGINTGSFGPIPSVSEPAADAVFEGMADNGEGDEAIEMVAGDVAAQE
jgi:hypothetical protein